MSNPGINIVTKFGVDDFMRLEHIHGDDPPEERDHRQISELTDEKMITLQSILQKLVNEGKIYFMDKEHGIASKASIVIGFQDNKLLICCER
jgi:hypothetical protein